MCGGNMSGDIYYEYIYKEFVKRIQYIHIQIF